MKTTTVGDVMTKSVVTASESTAFKHLVALMNEHRVSGIPIVGRDQRLVGMVTEADLLLPEGPERPSRSLFLEWFSEPRRLADIEKRAADVRARDVMTHEVVTVAPGTPVAQAAKVLLDAGVKRLPVVDGEGRLVGIVSRGDLLRPFLRRDADIRQEILEEVILRAMWIDPAVLDVAVRRGVATIAGRLERRSEKEILVELVRRVAGVVGVDATGLSFEVDDRETGRRIPLPETLRTTLR